MSVGFDRVAPPDDGTVERAVQASLTTRKVFEHTIPAGTGYGLRVEAGQLFRLVTVEHPQIVDLCVANADDPSEHYAAGAQLALEGGFVTRGVRIWGTPPRSRTLAVCTADTVRWHDDGSFARDHVTHGAHCNPHHWMLYTGRHPRTCYDNLRAGMAMLGLGQRSIHDNMNLFQKTALDPHTGHYIERRSDAEAGDYIEFAALIALNVVCSLCPQGGGVDLEREPDHDVPYWDFPVFPVRVEVREPVEGPVLHTTADS
jgi:uncharacterized protein